MYFNKKITTPLFGAVIGDVIGSVYEWDNVKTIDFKLFSKKSDFTDDAVLSIAVADCLLDAILGIKTPCKDNLQGC